MQGKTPIQLILGFSYRCLFNLAPTYINNIPRWSDLGLLFNDAF